MVGEIGAGEVHEAESSPAVLGVLALIDVELLAADAVECVRVAVGVWRVADHDEEVPALDQLELPLERNTRGVADLVVVTGVLWYAGAGTPVTAATDCACVAHVATGRDGAVVVHGVGEWRDVRLVPVAGGHWAFDEVERNRHGAACFGGEMNVQVWSGGEAGLSDLCDRRTDFHLVTHFHLHGALLEVQHANVVVAVARRGLVGLDDDFVAVAVVVERLVVPVVVGEVGDVVHHLHHLAPDGRVHPLAVGRVAAVVLAHALIEVVGVLQVSAVGVGSAGALHTAPPALLVEGHVDHGLRSRGLHARQAQQDAEQDLLALFHCFFPFVAKITLRTRESTGQFVFYLL